MKNIIIGLFSIIILVLLFQISFSLYGRSTRQQEARDSIENAMKTAMNVLTDDREYRPESNEEFVSDFLEAFLMEIESKSNVTVNILDVNYEKGLLSVEGILQFKYPNGKESSVSAQRTIILEQFYHVVESEKYTIQYIVDGQTYKQYTLKEGTPYITPNTPTADGKTFQGWKNINTDTIENINTKTVTSNETYVAVFN